MKKIIISATLFTAMSTAGAAGLYFDEKGYATPVPNAPYYGDMYNNYNPDSSSSLRVPKVDRSDEYYYDKGNNSYDKSYGGSQRCTFIGASVYCY
jgi:hypothetical protein